MVCGLCPPPQLAGNTNVTSADSSTLAAGTVNNPGICSNPITVGATEVGLCGAAYSSHELARVFVSHRAVELLTRRQYTPKLTAAAAHEHLQNYVPDGVTFAQLPLNSLSGEVRVFGSTALAERHSALQRLALETRVPDLWLLCFSQQRFVSISGYL
jgi:hypothetical protein